jgi:hypothetical protein
MTTTSRWIPFLLASTPFLITACNGRADLPTGTTAPVQKAAEEPRFRLFRDRTPDTGIQFTYHNGQEAGHYAILESLGGGVALFDYDGDG